MIHLCEMLPVNLNPNKLLHLAGSSLLIGFGVWCFVEGMDGWADRELLIPAAPALVLGVWRLKLAWQMPDDDPSDDPPA